MTIDYEEIIASRLVGLYENEIYEIISYIKDESNIFMKQKHKQIYDYMYNKIQKGDFVVASLIDDLLRDKIFADHAEYVNFIYTDKRYITTHDAYLHLKENQIRRRIIVLTEKTKSKATNGDDVFNVLETLREEIENIGEIRNMQTYKYMADILTETKEYITSKYEKPSKYDGYVTKFRHLDSIIGGIEKDNLIYMAARPSVGKTGMALKLAYNMSCPIISRDGFFVCRGLRVAFFSLEMSRKTLTLRLLSQISKVPINVIKYGKYDDETKQKIDTAIEELKTKKFIIDDKSAIDITHIKTTILSMPVRERPEVIFIDYLQLMECPKAGVREQEVAKLSAALKGITKEHGIPVICLAQLNRAVETRGGRPMLSDLRESGSLEQDADMVWFLNRPEKNGIEVFEDGTETKGIIEIIIAKNRNGSIGNARMKYIADCTDFSEI